ncbi:MAG: glycosyltransferase involved in cell wall biosynthesis [Flavobacteriaceae bacterium]|jgi:glycosyltransferase involved in cell wall biosynthesis
MEIANTPRFTVFTPTYNRGNLLSRVYESLLKQTYTDFEWVIIDDGSNDNTETICKGFIKEELIVIKYFKKLNGGKHSAWSFGINKFSGIYIICADSDDTKTPNMLEVYNYYWEELEKSDDYFNFWEIKTRCLDEYGLLVGSNCEYEILDSNNNEYYYKYKFKGEMSACRKKSVLLDEGLFPTDFILSDKCTNFSEGIIWSRVSRKYKTRFVNKITRIYTTNTIDSLAKGIGKKGRYNSLVSSVYSLSERRDLFLKYEKKKYVKMLLIIPYYALILNENINQFKSVLNLLDWFLIRTIHKLMQYFNILRPSSKIFDK